MRRVAAGALLLAAACSVPSASGSVALEGRGFAASVPSGWEGRATDPAQWADQRTVAIISSQALDPQCGAAGSSSAASDGACTTPLLALDDGAVLMWWLSETCAGAACEPPEEDRLLVGGRQASRVHGSSLCAGMGATREEAYLVAVTPQRIDAIVVCDRNATDATRAEALDVLDRIRWRTP